jgi:transposase
VSKDSIAVAVLMPDRDRATVERIFHDEVSVRRLIGRFDDRSRLWACYEAGPTGYDLYRLLLSMGVRCDVIAPSLIPKRRGDHVKTDKRDARQLAGLHRAGQLTPIGVPSPAQEAVRDLCRTRGDMVEDLTRARNRLTKFLLRHSVVWRDGSNWTFKHQRWLAGVRFDDRALAATFAHYRATVELRDSSLAAIEEDLAPYCDRAPFGDQVHHLAAYRGVTRMGGLCTAAEVFDWRRFPTARSFMSFTGLVPSENSTGSANIAATSPTPVTVTCAPNWSKPRGHTSTDHTSVPASPPATTASHPRSSPAPGPRRCVCRHDSANWPPARTSAPSSRPRSHASSPGSCGPR